MLAEGAAQVLLVGEAAGARHVLEAVRAALEPVIHWYQSDEHEPRPLPDIVADVVADLQADRAFVLNPPRHRYWMPGEADCPREIKAGNGELHTLRCKVCEQDNPRDEICRASHLPSPATPDDRQELVENFGGRIPENGLVSIPEKLYHRVLAALSAIPAPAAPANTELADHLERGWLEAEVKMAELVEQAALLVKRMIPHRTVNKAACIVAIRALSTKQAEA